MTLTNDVAELSGVVNLTLADVTLETDGRDCSFNTKKGRDVVFIYIIIYTISENPTCQLLIEVALACETNFFFLFLFVIDHKSPQGNPLVFQ